MKRIKKEIIKERVKAQDLNPLNLAYFCETCSYFQAQEQSCNLGHTTRPHLKQAQDHLFSLSGHMKFCRFLEID